MKKKQTISSLPEIFFLKISRNLVTKARYWTVFLCVTSSSARSDRQSGDYLLLDLYLCQDSREAEQPSPPLLPFASYPAFTHTHTHTLLKPALFSVGLFRSLEMTDAFKNLLCFFVVRNITTNQQKHITTHAHTYTHPKLLSHPVARKHKRSSDGKEMM